VEGRRCEAYLEIPPHFGLWRHFFCVKSISKRSGPVGALMFNLRSGLKAEWIDTDLPDKHRRVEVGVVLYCGSDSGAAAVNWPQASED
jgi:hypothetical protein